MSEEGSTPVVVGEPATEDAIPGPAPIAEPTLAEMQVPATVVITTAKVDTSFNIWVVNAMQYNTKTGKCEVFFESGDSLIIAMGKETFRELCRMHQRTVELKLTGLVDMFKKNKKNE